MEFNDLAEYCQAKALADKLHYTDEASWRSFCRRYSKLFHTPLHVVETLDAATVLLAVYEEQLDDVDLDNNMEVILDMIYTLEDPEYAKQKKDELKQFIKDSEDEEEERQKTGRPIHKLLADENKASRQKTLLETPPTLDPKLPHSGGINLSYLEKFDRSENDGEF